MPAADAELDIMPAMSSAGRSKRNFMGFSKGSVLKSKGDKGLIK